jgi:DNA-directed RNA polymerase specialized sigma24 family protein
VGISDIEFAEQYTEHFRYVVNYLVSRRCTPDEAEELAQQAWSNAWEKRETFRGEGLFRAWVIAIARNCFLAKLRPKREIVNIDGVDLKVESCERKVHASLLLDLMHPKRAVLFREFGCHGMGGDNVNSRVRVHRTLKLLRLAIFSQDARARAKLLTPC